MNSKKIWSNLAVSDLERTTIFYIELGFKFNGSSKELTSFLFGEDDFIIHFFLKDILKTAIKGEIADSQNTNEIIFTLSEKAGKRWTTGLKRLREPEENLFPGLKNLEKGIMV